MQMSTIGEIMLIRQVIVFVEIRDAITGVVLETRTELQTVLIALI